jgi:hypothetical protein
MKPDVFISSPIAFTPVVGQLIPAVQLRHTVEALFPQFAQDSGADCVCGRLHRWKWGHDLFVDLPRTAAHDGFSDAVHQLGHIVLTDLPTKTGVPIPGFSEQGLGHLLAEAGVNKAWLSLNLWDLGAGAVCALDGSRDLMTALSGSMAMNSHTMCAIVVKMSTEAALAWWTHNPILLLSFGEEAVAACVSAWKTFCPYVSPEHILAAVIPSLFVATAVTWFVYREAEATKRWNAVTANGIRSAFVSGCFAAKAATGMGALVGVGAVAAGCFMARQHARQSSTMYAYSAGAESLRRRTDDEFLPGLSALEGLFHETAQQLT